MTEEAWLQLYRLVGGTIGSPGSRSEDIFNCLCSGPHGIGLVSLESSPGGTRVFAFPEVSRVEGGIEIKQSSGLGAPLLQVQKAHSSDPRLDGQRPPLRNARISKKLDISQL